VKWSLAEALARLADTPEPFVTIFERGALRVELYAPRERHLQTPHTRDECYLVARGSGRYRLEDRIVSVTTGDLVFAPAGAVHRFEEFTEDFAVWVVFFGPEGGVPR